MIGTYLNTLAILVGTGIGCLLHGGIKPRYQEVLYLAISLAALGIGLENVVNNMQKSHYPVLFIVSIAVGAVLGTWGNLDERFNRLVDRHSQSQLGRGLSTGILLYCIGALSIVGPVMAAVKHDPTMLFTNATLDLISSVILGASFGAGMMLAAPKLAGGIYLVAKYLSASFFSASFITEISIVGGLLIAASGISLLKLREIKTVNLLPALLIPVFFFLLKSWV
ncbi:DUF554 domain-containing protein [Limosilactobacillus fermentum]|uniref:DUF554 domain-containing protein n=1 Tax=Limosilactobacillus fermentum TaxID=1613 RepID=UPI0021A4983D|nr:DUF554 domain-containing protein [Limosilactobacillus fermentum]MCT2917507.1 DUF554 domain-containing protein [Limosilactobacillus fermentum]